MALKEPLRIRLVTLEDVPALARLHLRSWQIAYRGIVPDEYLDELSLDQYVAMWSRIATSAAGNRTTWIAERDSIVVGYCGVGATREPRESKDTGEVYGIYVDPDQTRHGFGRALLRAGEGTLREVGFTQAALWVLSKNQPARRFYEMNGWSISSATASRAIGQEIRYTKRLAG